MFYPYIKFPNAPIDLLPMGDFKKTDVENNEILYFSMPENENMPDVADYIDKPVLVQGTPDEDIITCRYFWFSGERNANRSIRLNVTEDGERFIGASTVWEGESEYEDPFRWHIQNGVFEAVGDFNNMPNYTAGGLKIKSLYRGKISFVFLCRLFGYQDPEAETPNNIIFKILPVSEPFNINSDKWQVVGEFLSEDLDIRKNVEFEIDFTNESEFYLITESSNEFVSVANICVGSRINSPFAFLRQPIPDPFVIAMDNIIKNAYPVYGNKIVETIHEVYGDNYYIDISCDYADIDYKNRVKTNSIGGDLQKRFLNQIKSLCRRYPKLDEAQAFFDGRKIDGLATAASLQTIVESEGKGSVIYNGKENTTDTFNPINTATARTSSKVEREFIERNDATNNKNTTKTRTEGASGDGRNWELALSEGFAVQSPANEFIQAFADLLLLPPWGVAQC